MLILLAFFILFTLHFALATPTYLYIRNNCTQNVDVLVHDVGSEESIRVALLEPGQNHTYEFTSNKKIFTNGVPWRTQAMILLDWYKLDSYSVDIMNGFDVGMQVTSTKNDEIITCTNAYCFGYLVVGQAKEAPSGGAFGLTFCP